MVKNKDDIGNNYGIIQENHGKVRNNYGIILKNFGKVKENYGKIVKNSGKIDKDHFDGAQSQSFDFGNGAITKVSSIGNGVYTFNKVNGTETHALYNVPKSAAPEFTHIGANPYKFGKDSRNIFIFTPVMNKENFNAF